MNLLRADHPARELSGERGHAFTTLTTHHRVTFFAQQPLQREQFPATTDEPDLWCGRQITQSSRERYLEIFLSLFGRRDFEELRIVLLLIKHGYEPILEPQFTCAEEVPAKCVVLERTLTGEHRVTHALARGELLVKSLDEASRSLD